VATTAGAGAGLALAWAAVEGIASAPVDPEAVAFGAAAPGALGRGADPQPAIAIVARSIKQERVVLAEREVP